MNKPFNYGRLTKDDYFTNRDKESKWLEQQINSGINCMLISPRRWGKSSLVWSTVKRMKAKNKTENSFFIFSLDTFNRTPY